MGAVGLLVLIAATTWLNFSRGHSGDAGSPLINSGLAGATSTAVTNAGRNTLASGSGERVNALIASDDYYSGITVRSSSGVVMPGQSASDDLIVRRDRERDPSTQDFVERESVFSVSYDIVGVYQRTPSDIFIAGANTNGSFVVERWTFQKNGGAYYASRPAATTPLGTPFTTPPTTIEIVGTFGQPALGLGGPPLRNTVYQGTSMGPIRGLVVDPDGRYVLVLGGVAPGTAVYRLDLTSGANPELLYDSTTLPELTNTTLITPFDHDTLGRVFIAAGFDQPWTVVLYDPQNDGIIDGEMLFTVDTFETSGIPTGIVRDFIETY